MSGHDRLGLHAEGARPGWVPAAAYLVAGDETTCIPLINPPPPSPPAAPVVATPRRSWRARLASRIRRLRLSRDTVHNVAAGVGVALAAALAVVLLGLAYDWAAALHGMAVLPALTGPLWPAVPSGRAALGGACSHQPPDACPSCDGTRADEREMWATDRRAARGRRPLTRDEIARLSAANRSALRGAS